MDASIRFYNSNSDLHSVIDAERKGLPILPLAVNEESSVERGNEGEAMVDTHPQLAVSAVQEPVQKVEVADFDAIFLHYQGPITNFIYHLTSNREQAYDLTQDVFVKAYKALLGGTVVQPGALSAWLYLEEDRSGRINNGNSMYERGGYDGGRFESRVADREIVERVLKQMPPKYAVCLWLYENDGRSCAEIAEILHISASAVKMRLMRARERFINLYKQEVSEE